MYDDPHKAPAPEDIQLGVWYSFSYNPSSQPPLSAINRISPFDPSLSEWFAQEITSLFKRLKNIEIVANLEISRKGRFHLHGRILFLNIINAYAVDLRRLQQHGTYEIDTIKDPVEWNLYCRKQSSLMEPFCEIECIPQSIETTS